MLLEVTVEKPATEDTVWLITAGGELDFHTAPRFASTFSDATPPPGEDVVLDLSTLDFLDSSGLAAVVGLYHRLQHVGARLAVVSSRAHITRLFSATAVDRFLEVTPTRADAFAALAVAPAD